MTGQTQNEGTALSPNDQIEYFTIHYKLIRNIAELAKILNSECSDGNYYLEVSRHVGSCPVLLLYILGLALLLTFC